jgi:hypothetical protein
MEEHGTAALELGRGARRPENSLGGTAMEEFSAF